MANTNTFGVNTGAGGTVAAGSWGTLVILLFLAALVIAGYLFWPSSTSCPSKVERATDGSLTVLPSGHRFPDMNAFQQWWHSSGLNAHCPIPVLTGAKEVPVLQETWGEEQTYAKTPINKVDDYEFSRIFGYERDGHMDIPRQNFNVILENRTFDWADRPLTSDERRSKYAGLSEGFTVDGELKSVSATREATARYGEKPHHRRPLSPRHPAHPSNSAADDGSDLECRMSREAKEVAQMVARAYRDDPNWEPVVTRVGPHHWEVNELKPRRHGEIEEVVDERVVDTRDDRVDIEFKYREKQITDQAIDPYFAGLGDLPWESERKQRDPFYGPVPGMERMFGPTFDHKRWY